ncbi:putative Ca2+/H+ antiporter (TMEM165/GDT1 family) [Allostreptomyces psammosilenae]|uniref:GDT1 family protein n=2 Tax=Allostreptomyces psammosilenae TaxID=1892865 RepID=A0A853A0H9_9ACTN|nr:TMEM165/GDT1 family protein [Allostreptomyces psammosilenae]NYI04321.1 putative Ca2+/H+ antiporter (TMEM165/GDT1 family) [Allostreptomyces psammosilenae]
MDLTVVATTFVVIFLAELPDKSMFASLAMGTRMRPIWVWCGTAAAFCVHVAIAVAAGGVFALLPDRLVHTVAALLFGLGAWWMLRGHGDEDDDDGAPGGRVARGRWATVGTAFTVVFVGEWGDITQLATANLAATQGLLPVAVGAAAALMSVSALALTAGQALARRVSLAAVQRVGALVMAALAVWSLVEVIRG